MKIVVLGATGGTGLEIVRQAIDRGHSVTAFVRSPDRLASLRDQIQIRQGNLLNRSELEQVIRGHDAVLSAFGPRIPIAKAEKHLLQEFAAALAPAMSSAGVKRVLLESVAFLFKDAVIPPVYFLGKLLFPAVIADATAMEEIFRHSDLEWTLIRPPELTNSRPTGKYRVREDHLPRFGFSIPRADVAHCFLSILERGEFMRKIVGVAA
ncbi:MAG TPA: SDR family oxidoreductase [Bryobacteraceae bacterium]|jgi:putative NADH-flavin reductase